MNPSAADTDDVTDLQAFVRTQDQAAFERLVGRHEAGILSVCRRVLGEAGVAEEAAQAVWIVLARKAGRIHIHSATSLACWLHGVALRCAQALRKRRSQESCRQQPLTDLPLDPAAEEEQEITQALRHLDGCLDGLPAKYRQPLILCYLQGLTHQQAAERLSVPQGSMSTLINAGLTRLRRKFRRQGLSLDALAVLAGVAATHPAQAASGLATKVSSLSTTIAQEVLRTMYIAKLLPVAAALLTVGLGAGGTWKVLSAAETTPPNPPPAEVSPKPAGQDPANAERPSWASAAGQDQYGRWADLTVKGQVQRMRWIPPGKFLMGSPASEAERDDDEVQHEVTLTQGYWLGATEVTQGLWEAVMGSNPSQFQGDAQRPVERVSWDDCQAFLTRLKQQVPGGRWSLPSEAQWEYACRAGTTTPFSFGATVTPDQVNYNGNQPYGAAAQGIYREKTVPVGSFTCNPWGLFAMHGNVWEWCGDWYGDYPAGSVTDPIGPAAGSDRVDRGGSWFNCARHCRSAYRNGCEPGFRNSNIGFRFCAQSTNPGSGAP